MRRASPRGGKRRCRPLNEQPVHLGHDLPVGASGEVDVEAVGPDLGAITPRSPGKQFFGPVGSRTVDFQCERRRGKQLGDRPLTDDLAPVDDGHRVAGALDLVEQVGREDDSASFGHQGEDHLAHLQHARGVESVHRLVQDE